MSCIKNMVTLVFISYGLFLLDGFGCYFVSAPLYQYKLDYILISCSRRGHDIVSCLRKTAPDFILF